MKKILRKILSISLAILSISSCACIPSKAVLVNITDPVLSYARNNSLRVKILDGIAYYIFHNEDPTFKYHSPFIIRVGCKSYFIESLKDKLAKMLDTTDKLIDIFEDKKNSEEVRKKADKALRRISLWTCSLLVAAILPMSECKEIIKNYYLKLKVNINDPTLQIRLISFYNNRYEGLLEIVENLQRWKPPKKVS